MTNLDIDERESVWALKYRPTSVENMVLDKDQRAFFENMISSKKPMSMVLSGSPGVGKTTVSRAIVKELDGELLFLNGSGKDRGIDTVKTKIDTFAKTISLEASHKFVIYDESDSLTQDAQLALRSTIEDVSKNCTFILTANMPNRLINPILSRCHHIDLSVENSKDVMTQMVKMCIRILKNENVEFDQKAIVKIVKSNFPDFRKTINSLQEHGMSGRIDMEAASKIQKNSNEEFYKILKSKKFKDMHICVLENIKDYNSFMMNFWSEAPKIFTPSTLPYAAVYLDEAQEKIDRVANPNLTMVSTFAKIMSECEFNDSI